ncbi:helix-turn-helix transcriptional regulator [Paenibacillus montanisoli]|nr:AraC family transcriptional regulator [Paenibacillus montanisoli]
MIRIQLFSDQIQMPFINVTGFNAFQTADRLSWHKHHGFELTFVHKGIVHWEIHNHPTQHLTNGYASLMPPHVAHRGLDEVTYPCEMTYIVFQPGDQETLRHTPFTQHEMNEIYRIFSMAGPGIVKINSFVIELLRQLKKIFFLFQSDESQTHLLPMIRGILCQIIIECAFAFRQSESLEVSNEIQASIEYMEKHCSEDIGIKTIADVINKSESYLYNAFKNEVGLTPNEYILKLRLEQTREELLATDKSITEISLDAGFTTTQYFSSTFKRYFGCTPSNYRKMIKRPNDDTMYYFP